MEKYHWLCTVKSNQEPMMKHRGDENKTVKNYKYITCHFHHKCNQCACRTHEIPERNPTVLTEYKHVRTHTYTHTHTSHIYNLG